MSRRIAAPPSASLHRNVSSMWGAEGESWLRALPEILARVCRKWNLESVSAVSGLSFHFVARVRRADGNPAVVKIGYDKQQILREARWLSHLGGHGSVHLFASEPDLGALLIEELSPGTELPVADDEEATRVIAALIRRVTRTAGPVPAFPTVADWFGDLGGYLERLGGRGPIDAGLVGAAERTWRKLNSTATEVRLLHGDLHHGNVLAAEREPWLVIDPKGVVGDPAYEPAVMLWNSHAGVGARDAADRLAARLDILAEMLCHDRRRMAAWGFAQAVLSACWSACVGLDRDRERALATARLLEKHL